MVATDTLWHLTYDKDWDEVRKFLSSGPHDVSEDDFMANILYQDESGGTTLMNALYRKAPTDIIVSLIDKGGKELVMMKDEDGDTALHSACYDGASVEVVKLLLDVGGEELIVIEDDDGRTALDIANQYNVSDEVKQILKDAITSAFKKNLQSSPNSIILPLLESFVKVHGIDALFTKVDHNKGSPLIKLIVESSPSTEIVGYLSKYGAVEKIEAEFKGEYPTIRSDWNELMINSSSKDLVAFIKSDSNQSSVQEDLPEESIPHNRIFSNRNHAHVPHSANIALNVDFGEASTIQNPFYDLNQFLKKYSIPDVYAIHQSATSTVMNGRDFQSNIDVAIKFFSKYDHYKKELELRDRFQSSTNESSPIVPILNSYDAEKKLDRKSTFNAFDIAMSTRFLRDRDTKKPKVKLSHYKYAIVMPLADRDLETIYRNEMPSKTKCRDNLHDVLKDLDTLKKAGLTHCDVKAKNCVRINNKIKMIDLDAASEAEAEAEAEAEGDVKDNAAVFVGEKFSSGAVPPEMIYQLHDREEVEKYKAYFCELEESDEERWKKVQPIANKTAAFVVKTFLTVTGDTMEGMDGKSYTPVVVKDMDKLPYNLIVANESVDLWSFGLMVYKFETGVNVFKIDDQKDDLEGFPEMQRLAYWNEKEKNDTLLNVDDPAARSLLNILLSPDPVKRGTIAEALNHPYFTLKQTSKIEPLGESITKNAPVVVGPNQFQINSHVIDLPKNGKVDQTVATKVGEFLLHAVRNGVGEKQPAKGILVVVGSDEDFNVVGFCKENANKFEGKTISIHDWKKHDDFIVSCCAQDGSIFVDGQSGIIRADRYIINLPIGEEHADHGGGTGHMNASAAGLKGCLAIKCSEDICLTDGKGKGEMKVFSGTKKPTKVPVHPPIA